MPTPWPTALPIIEAATAPPRLPSAPPAPNTAGAAIGRAIATAVATTAISTEPIIPQRLFICGLGSVGLTSPIAPDGS